MALKKAKVINTDITADYWNIGTLEYTKEYSRLVLILDLYTSQESRNNGDNYVYREAFKIMNVTPSDIENNILEFAYAKLKEDNELFPEWARILVSPEIPAVPAKEEVKNEAGEVIEEAQEAIEGVPAVYMSYFEEAEDC